MVNEVTVNQWQIQTADSGRLSVLYKPVDRLEWLFMLMGFTSKEYQSSYKLIKVGSYYAQPQAALGGASFNDRPEFSRMTVDG